MSKISLTNLANLQNETTAVAVINADNAIVTTAMDNTLSRDGTSPNAMNTTLDMNSSPIINLPAAVSSSSPLRLAEAQTIIAGTSLRTNANVYDTVSAATIATILNTVQAISTAGYSSAGDGGGAHYTKGVGSTPGGFQSADGAWWKLTETNLTIEMCGGGTGKTATQNATAFTVAQAVLAARGGGIISFGAGTYQINALPTITDNNINVQGSAGEEASVLKFLTQGASANIGCIDWNTSLGASYTLSSTASEGTYSLVLTSVAGLAVGNMMFIKGISRPVTPNFPTGFITRIANITGTTLTLDGLLPHTILTTDSYAINKFTPIVGGGLRDLTIDPSAIVNAGTGDAVVRVQNVQGFEINKITIKNFPGPPTSASHIFTTGCFESRFVGVRSIQSSPLSQLQWYNFSTGCFFDDLYSAGTQLIGTPIFGGSGLFNCVYCQVGKQTSIGSMSRGVKHSGNILCSFDSIEVTTTPYDTLANGVCLSANYLCNFGRIVSNGAAIAAVWIANQEGYFQDNCIGEIVASNSTGADFLVDGPTDRGGGPGRNSVGQLTCRTVSNTQPESYLKVLSHNGALSSYGVFSVNRNGSNQTGMTGGAISKIQFTTATFNPSNFFDTATNFRYQPDRAGYYFIGVKVSANDEAADSVAAFVYKNGASVAAGFRALDPGPSAISSVSTIVFLNGTTDYVEGFVYLPSSITAVNGGTDRTEMFGWCLYPS